MGTCVHCLLAAALAVRGAEVVSARVEAAVTAVDWVRKVRRSSALIEREDDARDVVAVGARKAWLLLMVARRAASASFMISRSLIELICWQIIGEVELTRIWGRFYRRVRRKIPSFDRKRCNQFGCADVPQRCGIRISPSHRSA